jgi:hypothetical protein
MNKCRPNLKHSTDLLREKFVWDRYAKLNRLW